MKTSLAIIPYQDRSTKRYKAEYNLLGLLQSKSCVFALIARLPYTKNYSLKKCLPIKTTIMHLHSKYPDFRWEFRD